VLHKGTVNAAIAAPEERISIMKHATLIATAAALAIAKPGNLPIPRQHLLAYLHNRPELHPDAKTQTTLRSAS